MTVLVVDDEADVLKTVSRDLAGRRDLRIFYAQTADAAFAIVAAEMIDVAVVDLRLVTPCEGGGAYCDNGIDVIRRITAMRPKTIAILWSGWLSNEQVDQARDAGARFSRDKLTLVSQILAELEAGRRNAVPAIGTKTLARAEWEHIQRVLADSGNNVSESARRLGIERSVLQRKLKRLPPREFASKSVGLRKARGRRTKWSGFGQDARRGLPRKVRMSEPQ
jgi:two-component system, response regulator RegA